MNLICTWNKIVYVALIKKTAFFKMSDACVHMCMCMCVPVHM